MRSVRLKAKFFFLVLVLLGANSGYSDVCQGIYFHTDAEVTGSSIGKGLWSFITGKWGDLKFDPHLLKEIKVTAVKDQGISDYFNPKIQVCDYEGGNCYILPNKTSCHQIYGTQASGAGISAAVFIDWEGDTVLDGGKIKEGIAEGLEWEWADNVTDEEKVKFVNSPKICACSQKAACMEGVFSYLSRIGEGANIFRLGDMANTCDTCYQTTVKCAPVPLAPSPPPLCEQLAMSPPQVRIVPITNEKNDYFDPKVKVIIGDLIGKDGEIGEKLDFPRKYRKDKAGESPTPGEVREHSILDRDGTTHYFETYRKKSKLCTEYRGTEKEESQRRLQFPARCFPVPPAPEPKGVEVVNENTLKIEIKMSRENCMKQVNGSYSDGYCTFNISFDASEDRKKIDPRSFRVVKPKVVKKTTKNSNDESNITDVIEGILRKNPQLKILEKYGLTPNIGIKFPNGEDYSITNPDKSSKKGSTKLELDDMGLPKIEVRYMRVKDQTNSKRKMLCLSGWKPEPEEFVLKRESEKGKSEIILLKSMGVRYIKYNTVYSKESNQLYYFPCNETTDVLAKPQSELDKIIFNKWGYISIPEESTNRNNCIAEKDDEMDIKQDCNKCKIVYKLIDGERKEKCEQGQDGCLCLGEACSRSTQYLNKEDGLLFYLRYEEVDCKDKDGKTLKNEKGEIQKCTQLKDQLVKANRPEVFYADKLCRLYLKNLGKGVLEVIKKRLRNKNPSLPTKSYKFSGNNDYTDDLSQYDYIEIEAWGGGGAGYFSQSSSGLLGMPGDYIKAKLKIDPDHPIIRVEVGEVGRQEYNNMNGKPTLVKMCDLHKQNCLPLITVKGGRYDMRNWKVTKIHAKNLKLGNPKIALSRGSIGSFANKDKQIAYIEDGQMKYKDVEECREDYVGGAYGAGGCIDKSRGIYGRGSPGYVKISAKKTDYEEIDYGRVDKEVEEIIDALVKNPGSDPHVSDLIKKLYPNIIKEIKKEIKKELLGVKAKRF
ncbi:hypothetical protein GO685_01150 [Wolbachia endosymbiont of Madathamugadia hiepei]|uniref:hypothetical protein n=1 Tax=Wolbachia endosymbiont of Madathamugadia hiepei TaxID=1241303 RepID=UPI001589F1CD|nr:hypothetical protein [Wolbachia endosymbiont of Madathamugadia hiepei]NUX01131.1 hypothetical protein [Wolbachia endosymbiont of Madathamugadia hiepei]